MFVVGEPVLYDGKPYLLASKPTPANWCAIRDAEEVIYVHVSKLEDGIRADVVWAVKSGQ